MTDLIALKINIMDGDSIHVSVPESATVLQLMIQIKQKTGISEEEQRLIYLGRMLDREKRLAEYHIHDGVCIQLVRRTLLVESTSETENAEENQTIRTSYVVYLPFRITETTTVPAGGNENAEGSEGSSRPGRSSSAPFASLNTPMEGEPPVQRYPSASLNAEQPTDILQFLQSFNPQTDSHERLCSAVERLLEQGASLSEMNDPVTIQSQPLHATIHAIDKVISALLDYYHSHQNDDGVVNDVEEPLIHSSLNAIQSVSTIIKNVYQE